ncbi:unnamed protein product [Chilo suppressalis]|uniref:Major facilitator superfamily (MFS) profile domain-containing protein n=1 Tax=Chilo suppressalis TaxID=168631 RepID=A0ABN8BAA0_CHISP|nr:unnamed protein product [Chilo suppressalis]
MSVEAASIRYLKFVRNPNKWDRLLKGFLYTTVLRFTHSKGRPDSLDVISPPGECLLRIQWVPPTRLMSSVHLVTVYRHCACRFEIAIKDKHLGTPKSIDSPNYGSVELSNLSDYRVLPKTPFSPNLFTKEYLVIRQITDPMIRLQIILCYKNFDVAVRAAVAQLVSARIAKGVGSSLVCCLYKVPLTYIKTGSVNFNFHVHVLVKALTEYILGSHVEELDGAGAAIVVAYQLSQCSVIGWVTKNLLSRTPSCIRRHVKPLVPAASAVVLAALAVSLAPFSAGLGKGYSSPAIASLQGPGANATRRDFQLTDQQASWLASLSFLGWPKSRLNDDNKKSFDDLRGRVVCTPGFMVSPTREVPGSNPGGGRCLCDEHKHLPPPDGPDGPAKHVWKLSNLLLETSFLKFTYIRCSIRWHGRRCCDAARAPPRVVPSCGSLQPVLAVDSTGDVGPDDVHYRLLGGLLLFHTDDAVTVWCPLKEAFLQAGKYWLLLSVLYALPPTIWGHLKEAFLQAGKYWLLLSGLCALPPSWELLLFYSYYTCHSDPTARAQAFPTAGTGRLTTVEATYCIERMGHDDPPRVNADWFVVTTADAAGTNGFTCLPKQGRARGPILKSREALYKEAVDADPSFPVYISEISVPDIRGCLSAVLKIVGHLGVLFSFTIGAYLDWQQLALCISAAPLLLFCTVLYIPETPSYLVLIGKDEEAYKSLLWLRGPNSDVAQELATIRTNVLASKNFSQRQTSGFVSVWSAHRHGRKAAASDREFCFNVDGISWFRELRLLRRGELFPLEYRAFGSAMATAFSYLCAFVGVKTFVDFQQALGLHGAFWLYASISVGGLCFVVCCVPETKGKDLDEMDPNYVQSLSPKR